MDLRPRIAVVAQEGTFETKIVSAKALRMRRYREKLKTERINKYQEMCAREKDRKRQERQSSKEKRNKDPRELEKYRRKERERQQAYRNKKKAAIKAAEIEITPRSRAKKGKKSRTTQTPESKKKLAVFRTQAWRLRVQLKKKKAAETGKAPFGSKSTEFRYLKKAKESLPDTPSRRSKIVERLVNSPSTRKHLEKKGVLLTTHSRKKLQLGEAVLDSMKSKVNQIYNRRGPVTKEKRHAVQTVLQSALGGVQRYHKFGSAIAAHIKIRRPAKLCEEKEGDWWKPKTRKLRKDRLSDTVKDHVKSFYLSADVSREVPNKKDVLQNKGESVQRHVMTMTLSESYDMFRKENPEIKIGFTSFKKAKPFNVRKISETSLRSCLCQTCCNVALKVEALVKFSQEIENKDLNRKVKSWNKTAAASVTLCDYEEYPAQKCLSRECEKCGPHQLTEHLREELDSFSDDTKLTWYRWQYITVQGESGSTKRVTSCIAHNTTVKEMIVEMEKDLQTFPAHSFRATWQHRQMDKCIEISQKGHVTILMDYSENYRCRFQNESQNAFFDQQQVTVHPFMCYYKKNGESEGEPKIVKHAIIAISNDTKHDATAVEAFEKKVVEILKKEMGELKAINKFSDGAACQYKGKNSFLQVSKEKLSVSRNYFETSHGKSPCDGLGAIVKNACFNGAMSGKAVIGNAMDAYIYCKKKLEHGEEIIGKGDTGHLSKRDIIYIDSAEIKREDINVQTLVGTRKLHAVRNTGQPYSLEIRNLSCFCDNCIADDDGHCRNVEYVDPWTKRQLQPLNSNEVNNSTGDGTDVPIQRSDSSDSQDHPEAEESDDRLQTDKFVVVELQSTSRRTKQSFVAQILSLDGDNAELSFMVKKGTKYQWPDPLDISVEPRACVTRVLQDPILDKRSTSNRQYFLFQ